MRKGSAVQSMMVFCEGSVQLRPAGRGYRNVGLCFVVAKLCGAQYRERPALRRFAKAKYGSVRLCDGAVPARRAFIGLNAVASKVPKFTNSPAFGRAGGALWEKGEAWVMCCIACYCPVMVVHSMVACSGGIAKCRAHNADYAP